MSILILWGGKLAVDNLWLVEVSIFERKMFYHRHFQLNFSFILPKCLTPLWKARNRLLDRTDVHALLSKKEDLFQLASCVTRVVWLKSLT